MQFKNRKIEIYTWKVILSILLFRILIDVIYYNIINYIFGYSGFSSSFDLIRYLLSIIILIVFIPIIIRLNKRICFSSIIILLLFYLSFIPFTTMIAFYGFKLGYIINNIIYWTMLIIFYFICPKISIVRLKKDKITNLIICTIIFIFSATIIFISWKYTGFRINLNIFNVYDLRSEASNFNLPTVLSYIYSASKAVNPVLIVYFLATKRKKMVLFLVTLQLLSFSINGSKTVFFSTILSVIVYWIYNVKYIFRIPWFLSLISICAMLEFYVANTFNIVNILIRRVFFVPNLLNYYYYDFFLNNSPDYFSQSFLRHFGIESKYPPIDNMIGSLYFNKPDMGANNGLFSEAYANLGWIGILVMPIILVLALKILDACADGISIRVYVVCSINLAFIFISSFFSTMLLTHGFIALCLVLYLLPRKYNLKN